MNFISLSSSSLLLSIYLFIIIIIIIHLLMIIPIIYPASLSKDVIKAAANTPVSANAVTGDTIAVTLNNSDAIFAEIRCDK